MPGLRLYTSNLIEILAERLAEILRKPLSSPLDAEIIVVQSKGMERWISTQLAMQHGICANYRFPFPNAFVQEVFLKVLPNLPERSPFDPKILTWRIMKLLPSCIMNQGFKALRTYLKDTEGDLKRFQLSAKIADTFDQYLLFRPQMISKWQKGQETHWQAVLFRELLKECGKGHRATLAKEFQKAIKTSSTCKESLPERVSIFGIPALPRFHMQILSSIAEVIEVNLFLMNPCKEYWGDIASEWEIRKTTEREGAGDLSVKDLHLEKGNSLLGSMGRLGRDFLELVNEFEYEESSSFADSKENDLLSSIQSDILNLRDVPQEPAKKKIIGANDTSIQINSCHSPMREIEVLYDWLLHMFEKEPDLKPGDIMVMTPDIEVYSPYIQAVFDVPADDERKIPFSIADRSIRKEGDIIDSFLRILDLKGSRFGASQVLRILESQAVRRKFGLSEADLDLVQGWVFNTRIHWGIDEKNRADLGLPAFPENTWRAGLTRLLLGYSMPARDENMFGNILPYNHMEGSDTQVLGKFLQFAEQLFLNVASLGKQRTLDSWSEILTGFLESFFLPDEAAEREMQVIRNLVNDLRSFSDHGGGFFDKEIDINVLKWHLEHSLEREGFGSGFITGGVTFCAMLPMRSIPFRIICLVGMNNDSYPRESDRLGFDLMARHPEPGDRSRRNDDRYLFLEAILSARQNLYVSHVGQNIQDNSHIPPSVLVSELMDYIEHGFEVQGTDILDKIVTRHRLQAFSPEYFKESPGLFSYSEENLQAARSMLKERKNPVPFISRGLSGPDEEWKNVDLNDLCRFFGNPAQFLLNRRLRIYLGEKALAIEDRETFETKGLERFLIENELLKRRLADHDLNDLLPLTRAEGLLPHGTVGECIYNNLCRGVEDFVERAKVYYGGTALDPIEVNLKISEFRVTGQITTVYPERLIQFRYARIRPKDRLRTWIHHLALNSLMVDYYPRKSMLAGLDPNMRRKPEWIAWEYPPLENSKELLQVLLERYWSGLMKPLHFFPGSSWKYLEMLLERNSSEKDALNIARDNWEGNDFYRGECEDVHYQLCFRNTDPLDAEFKQVTKEVLGPLMEKHAKTD